MTGRRWKRASIACARAAPLLPGSSTGSGAAWGYASSPASIDTATPNGRLMFSIFSALAEFRHELIVKRTKVGLTSARARGHHGRSSPTRTFVGGTMAASLIGL